MDACDRERPGLAADPFAVEWFALVGDDDRGEGGDREVGAILTSPVPPDSPAQAGDRLGHRWGGGDQPVAVAAGELERAGSEGRDVDRDRRVEADEAVVGHEVADRGVGAAEPDGGLLAASSERSSVR